MLNRIHRIFLMLLAAVAAILAITPQSARAQVTANTKRIALVIGNSGYKSITGLTNPKNDATDIAAKLKTLKFELLLATDADHAKMATLLEEFKAKVTREH